MKIISVVLNMQMIDDIIIMLHVTLVQPSIHQICITVNFIVQHLSYVQSIQSLSV